MFHILNAWVFGLNIHIPISYNVILVKLYSLITYRMFTNLKDLFV